MIRKAAALFLTVIAVPLAAQAFEGTVTMNIASGEERAFRQLPAEGRQDAVRSGRRAGERHHRPGRGANDAHRELAEDVHGDGFRRRVAAAQRQIGGKNAAVVRTGKMETIAGYKCEHVTVTDDDGEPVDVCISSDLGGFRMPAASNPMSPQKEAGWMAQLGSTSFPLKVQKGEKTIMEVTAIEKKPLDAALFEAPEGYQSFSMPVRPKKPPQD